MFVTQVEKMEEEEKEIAMKGRGLEIGKEEKGDHGLVQEIEVNENVVEDQGLGKENDEDLDQETRRKVDEVLDHALEIDVIEGIETEIVEREELRRMTSISKRNPFGKMKSMLRKSQWKIWVTMVMAEVMEIMKIKV